MCGMSTRTYRGQLHRWWLSVPPPQRSAMLLDAGLSPQYVERRIFTTNGDPVFRIDTATQIARLSNGAVDFRKITAGGINVDWDYVTEQLLSARKS